jgi:glyoxylase-like metal-dependent hydrolase (beta-lactamase superfamily II)
VRTSPREIADGVLCLRTIMVNLFVLRGAEAWVLVDAGFSGFAGTIREAAARFTGGAHPPAAIVLTHGHFDHVGSLPALLESWDVPVLCHALERPFLTGAAPYPPADPLVGRGVMSLFSRLYPRGPIDLGSRLERLADGQPLPGLPEWRTVHTPGHTAGHISLFRERDRTLLSGDAVTTTRQESLLAVAVQRRELHGPPAYFTQDWGAATESAGRLAALEPEVLGSGHGEPWGGAEMRAALRDLAAHFTEREVPAFGRYVSHPAIANDRGVVALPPDPLPRVLAGAAIAAAVAFGASRTRRDPPPPEK